MKSAASFHCRPLGQAEQMMWMADRISPLNFMVSARVEGNLDFDAIRAGVEVMVTRYPVLLLSIEDLAGAGPNLVPAQRPISIDVLAGGHWAETAVQDINRPFDCPIEPLIRVRWLRNSDHHLLMLTLHHSIADGRAGLTVLQSLLAGIEGFLKGETGAVKARPPGLAIEDRPMTVRGGNNHPVAARGLRFEDAPGSQMQRRTVILPFCFDEKTTERVTHASRQAGCTVHGLLSATHLQAVAEEHGSGMHTLSLSSPLDLRRRMTDYHPEEVGLFVGNSHLVYGVDPGVAPWSLARRISGDIKRASAANSALGPRFDGCVESLRKIYAARASTAISNLGRIKFADDFSQLEIKEIHFAVACSTMGDQIVTTTCHAGRMTWCLCPALPTIDGERARRIARRSVERLIEAAEQPAYF